jgi:FMN phosphatase YigB (HAD superfamily)
MSEIAFLFDVDNTLIDNDGVKADLAAHVQDLVGAKAARSFWSVYEEVRGDKDRVDFSHTRGRFRAAFPDHPGFPALFALSATPTTGTRRRPRMC